MNANWKIKYWLNSSEENLILNLSAARQLSEYLSMAEEYLEIKVTKPEQSVAIIIMVEEREILKMSVKMLSEELK